MKCDNIFQVPTVLSGVKFMRNICLSTGYSCSKLRCPKNNVSTEVIEPDKRQTMLGALSEMKAATVKA